VDKDSLIGKEKAAHASKTKQNEELIHYFQSVGRRSAISGKAGLHHT